MFVSSAYINPGRCRERVNVLARLNRFFHVVSCSGSQTSVSVQSLQITVCERCEIHTKGTSLPKAGILQGFSNSNYNKAGKSGGYLGAAFTLTQRQSWDREGGILMALQCFV